MNSKPDYIKEEASRLKAIYMARKKADPSLTQDKIADHFNWSGQSAVSQYMSGRIPLNLEALIGFARILQFRPSDVSPRLIPPGDSLDSISPSIFNMFYKFPEGSNRDNSGTRPTPAPEAHITSASIEAWDDDTPLASDEVELPFYKEVELSAGQGSEVMLETTGRKLRFGKRTLQKKQISRDAAACVRITGDSMEPVLPDGCTVAIDTRSSPLQDGKMYAIDHAGQLRVKVLYQLPAGGLRVRSYNDTEYPEERYDSTYVEQNIRIIGKVFWYSVLL